MKMTEQELKDCLNAGMGATAIGKKYGIAVRAVQARKARLAAKGFSPEHDMKHQVPDGFLMKGQSTLYGNDGSVKLTWVKSAIDRDRQIELIQEFIEGMKDELPRELPADSPTRYLDHNLANQFTITDYHMGMLAWGEESGDDWDLSIAYELLIKWFRAAIDQSPNAKVAILAQLGDFLHWDGLDAVTPSSGHVLDADSRFQKLTRVAIKATRAVIKMLLEKHETVHVIFAEGNHDIAGSVWMREFLSVLYENEPRVYIDKNPDPYYCYTHGKVMLGYHHGHKKRIGDLSQVFAAKFRKEFGASEFAYVHTGHLHHQKTLEDSLMIVEQHRTLAAKDAYASRGGWLSGRSAAVITYHKAYGEVCRQTISPAMVEGQPAQ